MATPGYAVSGFRFRADDGSETSASWLASLDTNASVSLSGNKIVRLRLALECINLASGVTQFGLKVSHNGGAAASIGSGSSYVQGAVSSFLTDQAAATYQLSEGSANFVSEAGEIANNINGTAGNGTTTCAGIAQFKYLEIEWTLELIAAQLAPGDTLDFTVVSLSGTSINSQYSGSVRLTIGSRAALPWPLLFDDVLSAI